jgi:pimeloyl-ACP methyl ester carboxylesterase
MRALLATLVAALALVITTPAAVAQPKPTIVLVHGAWADASGWSQEIEALQKRGYTVLAPANPLRGLLSDASYLHSVLETIDGPAVLVGHSYGGAVISNAATGLTNVKALVYVAAFVPDEGEALAQLTSRDPGSLVGPATLVTRPYPLADGSQGTDLYLSKAGFRTAFAGDVPRRTADSMWAQQRPLAATAFAEPSGAVAWKTLPSWYLVAAQDRTIPPATQRFMAKRAGARVTRVQASHVAMVSEPAATVKLILAAAR